VSHIGPIFVLDVDGLVIGAISEFLEEVSIFCWFEGCLIDGFWRGIAWLVGLRGSGWAR
jgi:hypothetical protein